ncbi:hypothetical protein ACN28S_35160 [Cystobacter fuscus]
MKERPGSGHARLLLAEVHVARGERDAAARALASCLECWRGADAHLSEIQRARLFRSERVELGGGEAANASC